MNRSAQELANTIASAEQMAGLLWAQLDQFAPGERALIEKARELYGALRSRVADTWLNAQ